ncbi:MAG: cytochrome c oxidase accessory protein CcoG [Myxococcales bacterium]|nr:cytochrome c oxidase accessory protein CcoG [Myxococcales bacterium]
MSSEDSPRPGTGVVYLKASSLRSDGSRNYVHPADVTGRFHSVRKMAFLVLLVLLAGLPWLEVNGHPAVFLDVDGRRFFLFGHTFNAQDFWLVFFLLSGIGYALIVVTALWGRVWCGYACPQTVFLEGLFRPIERLIDGSRNARLRRRKQGLGWSRIWRFALKHTIYLLLAFLVSHIVVSYFVSIPALYEMVLSDPSEHPEAFVWATALTGLLYLDFAWFREQLCLIVCPYGRLQSVLTDRDTLVIGYDRKRGEPRGKVRQSGAGACVDCKRCVAVCPTGIDIRNGLQLDCIGCARCVDACDEVMGRLGRAPGLVRYDSLKGLLGRRRRVLRPRLYLYTAFGLVGLGALGIAMLHSRPYEANLLRLRDLPYVVEGDSVRNAFELHLVNKRAGQSEFSIEGAGGAELHYAIALPRVALDPLQSQRIPIFVSYPRRIASNKRVASLRIIVDGEEPRTLTVPLTGPDS